MSGRIYTFFSWKGGVGRTMALANVGVQLARRGKRVLLVDWDLEAPGVDQYFHLRNTTSSQQFDATLPPDSSGLLGLLVSGTDLQGDGLAEAWKSRCVHISLPEMSSVSRSTPVRTIPGVLHILGSGFRSAEYALHLQEFSWSEFFGKRNGAGLLESLRTQWQDAFDVVLIDSRTGLTDSGGVCTVQMPDAIVLVFTANYQSLEDGLAFLRGVQEARAAFPLERAPLTIVPLLARWEGDREVDLADAWLDRISKSVASLVENWLPSDIPIRRMLERLRVPHVARFSFGEPLPVLTHSLSDPERPGLAYDLLAELLANGFAGAGQIIEPGYQPALDPEFATDAEIEQLLFDDEAREVVFKQLSEGKVAQSWEPYAFMLRVADVGLQIGRISIANSLLQRVVLESRRRLAEDPEDIRSSQTLCSALISQGDARRMVGILGDALLAYRESLFTAKRLVESNPSAKFLRRNIAIASERIGDVLREQGNLVGALAAYRESLELSKLLKESGELDRESQRDLAVGQSKIADVLRDQGDLKGAHATYREALDLARRLLEDEPTDSTLQRDVSVGENRLGDVLFEQGDFAGALAAYRAALALRTRMSEGDASAAAWQRDLSVSHCKVGDVLRAQGELEAALGSFRQALDLSKHLAEADPSNAIWQRDLGVAQERIGDVLKEQGDSASALNAYRESLVVSERLAEADPSNANWQRDLSIALSKVGDILILQGDLAGALSEYGRALTVSRRLAEGDPSNAGWLRDLGISLDRVGDVLTQQGDVAGALKAFNESLGVCRRLADADSSNAVWQRDLASSLVRVAEFHLAEGNHSMGLSLARESLSISLKLLNLDSANKNRLRDVELIRDVIQRLEEARLK